MPKDEWYVCDLSHPPNSCGSQVERWKSNARDWPRALELYHSRRSSRGYQIRESEYLPFASPFFVTYPGIFHHPLSLLRLHACTLSSSDTFSHLQSSSFHSQVYISLATSLHLKSELNLTLSYLQHRTATFFTVQLHNGFRSTILRSRRVQVNARHFWLQEVPRSPQTRVGTMLALGGGISL